MSLPTGVPVEQYNTAVLGGCSGPGAAVQLCSYNVAVLEINALRQIGQLINLN